MKVVTIIIGALDQFKISTNSFDVTSNDIAKPNDNPAMSKKYQLDVTILLQSHCYFLLSFYFYK